MPPSSSSICDDHSALRSSRCLCVCGIPGVLEPVVVGVAPEPAAINLPGLHRTSPLMRPALHPPIWYSARASVRHLTPSDRDTPWSMLMPCALTSIAAARREQHTIGARRLRGRLDSREPCDKPGTCHRYLPDVSASFDEPRRPRTALPVPHAHARSRLSPARPANRQRLPATEPAGTAADVNISFVFPLALPRRLDSSTGRHHILDVPPSLDIVVIARILVPQPEPGIVGVFVLSRSAHQQRLCPPFRSPAVRPIFSRQPSIGTRDGRSCRARSRNASRISIVRVVISLLHALPHRELHRRVRLFCDDRFDPSLRVQDIYTARGSGRCACSRNETPGGRRGRRPVFVSHCRAGSGSRVPASHRRRCPSACPPDEQLAAARVARLA